MICSKHLLTNEFLIMRRAFVRQPPIINGKRKTQYMIIDEIPMYLIFRFFNCTSEITNRRAITDKVEVTVLSVSFVVYVII